MSDLPATRPGPAGAGSLPAAQDAGVRADEGRPPPAAEQPRSTPPGLPRGSELRTRHARLQVAAFDSLPGWAEDDLGAGWEALLQSCRALQRRAVWSSLCSQAAGLRTAGDAQRRSFLQSSFTVLRILNPDASAQGTVTGYFEPLLAGAAQRQGAFRTPVYGVPSDLLLLDRRELGAAGLTGMIMLRAQGNTLKPLPRPEPGSLTLDPATLPAEPLDRYLRLRRQGDRAVPYYSRAELAALDRPQAQVLAWVDDPVALYAMQVQGSGRIRFPDGRVLRLEYGEQNGHPFRPLRVKMQAPAPGASSSSGPAPVTAGGTPARTRSLSAAEVPQHFELEEADPAAQPDPGEAAASAPAAVGTRSIRRPGAASPAKGRASSVQGRQRAAQALVDELLPQAQRAGTGARAAPATPPAESAAVSALLRDPSFVFFRVAADQQPAPGPVGALGVPLTPGRSVAIDPRSAPLGYPVFLFAQSERGDTVMRKLMFAQDAGGAIRGAVRADHFWGFGQEAGRQAARTRLRGQMWLLMPQAEALELFAARSKTRSVLPGCVFADDEHCVD